MSRRASSRRQCHELLQIHHPLVEATRSPAMAQIRELCAEHLDRVGIVTSALCFVHCIATPVVLSLSAVSSHFLPSENHTRRVLAVFVTIVGALAIGSGYRTHKRKRVLAAVFLGLLLICSGAYFGDLLPS